MVEVALQQRGAAHTKTSPLSIDTVPSKITYIKMDPRSCIRNGFANGPQLICIERECEVAIVDWRINRLYMAIQEGVNKDLLP